MVIVILFSLGPEALTRGTSSWAVAVPDERKGMILSATYVFLW